MTNKTLSECYLTALNWVWTNPQFKSAPRGQPIREVLSYSFATDIDQELVITTRSQVRNAKLASYFAKELALYQQGTLRAEDFASIGKIWASIANPDGTINSNYGYLAFMARETGFGPHSQTHWEWCLDSFKADLDTRQAVIHFSRPRHLWHGNKDQVCALSMQFFVRDHKIYGAWTIRSNDLVFGTPYDAMFALWLCRKMAIDLSNFLKTEIGLGVLHYTANNLHIYERDKALVEVMLGL